MRVQEDVEQRGIGKDAYQESQNAEGDSDALTLHKLLETSFRILGRVWLQPVNFLKKHLSIFEVLNID